MPPRQRTNSIADGQSRAITWASWPAPDGSRIGVWPSSVTLAASASCIAGAQCAVAISWNGSMETVRPRALAMRDASAANRPVASTRNASVSDRRSTVNSTRPGMMLTAPGDRLDAADGADHAVLGMLARDFFQRQRHLGRAGIGIATEIHRHGAGVPGLAGHGDAEPDLADDAGDDAERLALGLQHRPLLDMHLDVARGILGPVGGGGNIVRIFAVGPQRIGERHAVWRRPWPAPRSRTRRRRPTTTSGSRGNASPPRRRTRARRCRMAARPWRARNAPPPGCRRRRRAGRRTCRRRSRCRCASRSGAAAWRCRSGRARCRAHPRSPTGRPRASSRQPDRRRGDAPA